MCFFLLETATFIQVLEDLLAGLETVHAGILPAGRVQVSVVVENIDRGKPVLLTEGMVVDVVG